MAKKKTRSKVKREALVRQPALTINTDKATSLIDKLIAKCKVWIANFVKWLKTLNTPTQ